MPSVRLFRSCCVLFTLLLAAQPTFAVVEDNSTSEQTEADRGPWTSFSELVDRLPTYVSNTLPVFDPNGLVKFYSHPHLGDLFKAGYIRVPVGVKAKITDRIDANMELQGYIARGAAEPSSPYGLSNLNIGAKCERLFTNISEGGFAVGFGYRTPLGRPPVKLTDGYRHFQPYISMTRMVVPQWKLLGYSSIGVNLMEHAPVRVDFGRNQLHGNSIQVVDGLAREWERFQLSLTARYNTTGLITDEFHQNFSLKPEIVVPWRLRANGRTKIFLSFNSRVIWGPQGRQISTGSGMRVQFHLDRNKVAAN
jgi:hypothetical protein